MKLPYSPRLLTNPEANIRMGTAYFADMVKEFGDLHLALASYNAGERPVRRWMAERPGLARDEFIDDIPFPETQNYVKKILGTAEDYRRSTGPDGAVAGGCRRRAGGRAPARGASREPPPHAAAKKPRKKARRARRGPAAKTRA